MCFPTLPLILQFWHQLRVLPFILFWHWLSGDNIRPRSSKDLVTQDYPHFRCQSQILGATHTSDCLAINQRFSQPPLRCNNSVEQPTELRKTLYLCLCVCSVTSVVSNSLQPLWTVAHQALLSMGFSRQEYWSGLLYPPPGDLPDQGIELKSPALQADSRPLSHRVSLYLYLPVYYKGCNSGTAKWKR